jgi:hypothetical protein
MSQPHTYTHSIYFVGIFYLLGSRLPFRAFSSRFVWVRSEHVTQEMYALQMKGCWESWFPFMHSQKWNCPATLFPKQNYNVLSPNSYTHISVGDLYFLGSVCLFCCSQICGPILGIYINRSQTHECRNWEWGHTIPFLGIQKLDFQHSVLVTQQCTNANNFQQQILIPQTSHTKSTINFISPDTKPDALRISVDCLFYIQWIEIENNIIKLFHKIKGT